MLLAPLVGSLFLWRFVHPSKDPAPVTNALSVSQCERIACLARVKRAGGTFPFEQFPVGSVGYMHYSEGEGMDEIPG